MLDSAYTPQWFEEENRKEVLMRAAAEPNPIDQIPTEDLEMLAMRSCQPDYEREHGLLSADAAERWVDEHPEYLACPSNGKLMVREMERLGLDSTRPESFDAAFQSLHQDELVLINEEAAQQLREEVRQERRRHRVGSLSAKRSAPVFGGDNQAPDYDRMTSEQLRDAAYRAAASGEL